MAYVISYDVGTGATKAVLIDMQELQILGKTRVAYGVHHPRPNQDEPKLGAPHL